MKTINKARVFLMVTVTTFLLCTYLKSEAQINLLLNGDLSESVVDSNKVKNRDYANQRINVKLPYWDEINACQADYNPAFSHKGKNYILNIAFQRLGEHDFRIANVTGMLCRPLLAGKKYVVSFYVKPFSGNALAAPPDVLFSDTLPLNQLFIDERDKAVPSTPALAYRNPLKTIGSDSFTHVAFEYQAKGNEKYITIGNFEQGKPRNWKRIKPYGIMKATFGYSEWCMYAISDMRVVATDSAESGCPPGAKPKSINLMTLYYETNQSLYIKTIDSVVAVCNTYPDYTLEIIGYTDQEGSSIYNQNLSAERAAKIAALLQPKIKNKIIAKGMGPLNPVEPISPSAKNRRVELWLVP